MTGNENAKVMLNVSEAIESRDEPSPSYRHGSLYTGDHIRRRDFFVQAAGGLAAAALGACRTPDSYAGRASLTTPAPVKLDAAAFRAARRFTKLRYGRIVHVERGRGPAALFIHGYPLNGYQWRGALERLSPYRRCITPDLLGLGYTETPATQSSEHSSRSRAREVMARTNGDPALLPL